MNDSIELTYIFNDDIVVSQEYPRDAINALFKRTIGMKHLYTFDMTIDDKSIIDDEYISHIMNAISTTILVPYTYDNIKCREFAIIRSLHSPLEHLHLYKFIHLYMPQNDWTNALTSAIYTAIGLRSHSYAYQICHRTAHQDIFLTRTAKKGMDWLLIMCSLDHIFEWEFGIKIKSTANHIDSTYWTTEKIYENLRKIIKECKVFNIDRYKFVENVECRHLLTNLCIDNNENTDFISAMFT